MPKIYKFKYSLTFWLLGEDKEIKQGVAIPSLFNSEKDALDFIMKQEKYSSDE